MNASFTATEDSTAQCVVKLYDGTVVKRSVVNIVYGREPLVLNPTWPTHSDRPMTVVNIYRDEFTLSMIYFVCVEISK